MFEEFETVEKIRFIKAKLLSDPVFFTRFFFKYQQSKKFIIGEHHLLIGEKIKKIFRGEITRLIINMPPRYSKTEMVVKTLIAMGLALNARAKFIHTSYSDMLALDNSEAIKDLINSDEFQYFFPIGIKPDSKSKKKWYTSEGGGVYATASGGQITGFGAGIVDDEEANLDEFASDIERMEGFGGAFIIDDPIKPEDAKSMIVREGINERFDSTFRSRVNSRKTPFILVMQRVHSDDLTGYLTKNEPEDWDILSLPALKEDGEPLWPFKHTKEELHKLSKINPQVYYFQYQQEDVDIQTGGEYLSSFNIKTHMSTVQAEPETLMNISIDNNVYPYISVSFFQTPKDEQGKYQIRQVHHIAAKDPDNTASKAGKMAAEYLKKMGYNLKNVRLYGDRSTKNRNTIDDEKRSFAELFIAALRKYGYQIEDKMLNHAPSPATIGEFVNAILAQELDFAEIIIDESCTIAKKDYLESKKDKDGKIDKHRVTDPRISVSYEENGHCCDNLKDYIVAAFNSEFVKFQNRYKTIVPGQIKTFDRKPKHTF